MTDSEIIWKYLSFEILDSHLCVYLYVCGNVRSPKIAIDKIVSLVKPIFSQAIHEDVILSTINDYLENKKRQYLAGEIKVVSIY